MPKTYERIVNREEIEKYRYIYKKVLLEYSDC